MAFLYIYRTVIFAFCIILTIPLLGLLAHWTSGSIAGNVTYSFEPVGLLSTSLTLIIIPIMLVLPEIRKNAFMLYIVSELTVVCLLWILWVVAAALAIQQREEFYPLDNCTRIFSDQVHWCNELFAIVGLSVVVFVLLLKYMLFLIIYATIMTFRVGGQVWFRSVKDAQIAMPRMTHTSGDLESKARRDDSTLAIPLETSKGGASAFSVPSLQTGSHLPKHVTSAPRPPAEIQDDRVIAPSMVAMQVIPAQKLNQPSRM